MGAVEDVAARLRTQVPSRPVFELAIPDGPVPSSYLLVRASVSSESSDRMCDTTNVESSVVRILSVARHNDPYKAALTADTGSRFAREALRDWRPGGSWRLRYVTAQDAARDTSIAETTFTAALQYSLRRDL